MPQQADEPQQHLGENLGGGSREEGHEVVRRSDTPNPLDGMAPNSPEDRSEPVEHLFAGNNDEIPLAISALRTGMLGTIQISGELDLHGLEVLAGATVPLLEPGRVESIELDVSDLTFIDSARLAAVLALRGASQATGIRFSVIAASPQFLRVLDLTGLAELLDVELPP